MRTISMTNVSPELFRRRMTFRAMDSVKNQITKFNMAAIHDNVGAVTASYNELAALVAELAGRKDLAQQFARKRDALIEEIRLTPPMRRPRRKAAFKQPPKK